MKQNSITIKTKLKSRTKAKKSLKTKLKKSTNIVNSKKATTLTPSTIWLLRK
jgi:hypothetical protein